MGSMLPYIAATMDPMGYLNFAMSSPNHLSFHTLRKFNETALNPIKSHYVPIMVGKCGSVSKPCTPGEHQNSW